ncbi:hypothetical protein [Halococcus sp. IIIV-5B]|uniref:hypothetical protein n=1 Tax=Halococcus sp. IIIV-5B TaxID=2321230 RepID=UPI001313D91B|nr:hypothetical protein [Halococcus sp. IIIV-5B]
MRWRSLVVVVLVILAGCNGVLDGGDGESTSTVTPAAVPTDRPTATAHPALAPGLTQRGIEDPDALLAAHADALDDRSFTTRSNTTVEFPNGSVTARGTSTTYAGPPGEAVRLVLDRNGTDEPTHIEAWQRDGELLVNRTYTNGTTTYDRIAVGSQQRIGTYGAGSLEYLFDSTSLAGTSVAERERNGTPVYVVRGRTEGQLMDGTTFRLVVDSDGRIQRYRVTRATFAGNESATATTVVTYDDVGTTPSPERPAWVDTARERTTTVPGAGTTTETQPTDPGATGTTAGAERTTTNP